MEQRSCSYLFFICSGPVSILVAREAILVKELEEFLVRLPVEYFLWLPEAESIGYIQYMKLHWQCQNIGKFRELTKIAKISFSVNINQSVI
jgi:hypothetical protein